MQKRTTFLQRLALMSIVVCASAWLTPAPASAQTGYEQYAAQCRANGGVPHPADSTHPTATCSFGGASSGQSPSSDGPNYGPVIGIIGAVINGVQEERNHHRREVRARAHALNDQGIAASRSGDYVAAERYFAEAARLRPEDRTIANNLSGARQHAAQQREQQVQAAETQRTVAELTQSLNRSRPAARVRGLEFQTGGAQSGGGGSGSANAPMGFMPGSDTNAVRQAATVSANGANVAEANGPDQTFTATHAYNIPSTQESITASDIASSQARLGFDTGAGAARLAPQIPVGTPTSSIDPVVPEALRSNPRIIEMERRRGEARRQIATLREERARLNPQRPEDQVRMSEIDNTVSNQHNEEIYANFEINVVMGATPAAGSVQQGNNASAASGAGNAPH